MSNSAPSNSVIVRQNGVLTQACDALMRAAPEAQPNQFT
jgi:hypothetical protein